MCNILYRKKGNKNVKWNNILKVVIKYFKIYLTLFIGSGYHVDTFQIFLTIIFNHENNFKNISYRTKNIYLHSRNKSFFLLNLNKNGHKKFQTITTEAYKILSNNIYTKEPFTLSLN